MYIYNLYESENEFLSKPKINLNFLVKYLDTEWDHGNYGTS